MKKEFLLDVAGRQIEKGSFVELLSDGEVIPSGTYKYQGFRWGSHVWSVGPIEFASSDLERGKLKLLSWKRWREPQKRIEQFLKATS